VIAAGQPMPPEFSRSTDRRVARRIRERRLRIGMTREGSPD
jgi:hypothetical protein